MSNSTQTTIASYKSFSYEIARKI